MKQHHVLLCLPTLCLSFIIIALYSIDYSIATTKLNNVRRVIVDVDPGIDDLEALVFLINADNKNTIKLQAIVVTEGNTNYQYGIRNVFFLLSLLNRIDIPVYLGSKRPILEHDEPMGGYFGVDGIGDLNWTTKPPIDLLKNNDPYKKINELVHKYPKQITYMTLAPMTTLGMTIYLYPNVAKNLRDVYSMGGLIYNNEGEFNVKFDAEAVDIVLRALKSKMVLITWQAGETNSPMANWYKNITSVNNPAWNFMTKIQDALNKMLCGEDLSNCKWEHCDPIVPAVFLNEKIILKQFTSALEIEVGRGPNRGIMNNSTKVANSVDVILEIDYDLMLKDYISAFTDICKTKTNCLNVV